MLTEQHQVYDQSRQTHRPITPGDIAILSQTWAPIARYGDAIAARDIPILPAGGGNVLETREAKDGLALLQFLADPTDNLALAAVLRSPWFAVSDVVLYRLAQALPEKTSWWKFLRSGDCPDLAAATATLQTLVVAKRTEAPSRLLQMADRHTGYTAVIANLPGSDRRWADWRGFVNLVRDLEAGSFDVVAVTRRLQRLIVAAVKLDRPALAGENAVSLMTIHGSKGLEWPVVIVPDLTRQGGGSTANICFDAALGVALKLTDDAGEPQKSALYTLLEQQSQAKAEAEAKRLLYVALTRARDHLILTAAGEQGHNLELLQTGLDRVVTPTPIPFDPDRAQPVEPPMPPAPERSQPVPPSALRSSAGSGLSELPVTALSEYAWCPLRFRFHHVDGHPGYYPDADAEIPEDGAPAAMAIGTLTHKILELDLPDLATAHRQARSLDRPLTARQIQTAWALAQQFHTAAVYKTVRDRAIGQEQVVALPLDGLTLHGSVDLVGDDFVLDFKTDREVIPEHHQFQLWAYARALEKPTAHLAYLRHDHLHQFNHATLGQLDTLAHVLIQQIRTGDFAPTPHAHQCDRCPYVEICEMSSAQKSPRDEASLT